MSESPELGPEESLDLAAEQELIDASIGDAQRLAARTKRLIRLSLAKPKRIFFPEPRD